MKLVCTTAAIMFTATLAFGDSTVQQKTQVHVGGAIGAIANVFGGKATHDGLESTVVIKGDRKSTMTGRNAEIVDLSEEKIYRLDYDRKSYKVVTFAELRKQYEESKAREEKNNRGSGGKAEKNEGPEYEVEFAVKETGTRETINGFATKETIVTVTVHEKGKTLAQSGGFVLTSDMFLGPKIAAMKEISDFDRRYFQKLYGASFAADMAQMAMLMATTPAFGKAMKVYAEKSSALQGTAVRTTMTFDTVGSPQQAEKRDDDAQTPAGALMGGLMNRMKKKRAESSDGPEKNTLFTSSVEILKAGSTASSDAVTIPAGFTKG